MIDLRPIGEAIEERDRLRVLLEAGQELVAEIGRRSLRQRICDTNILCYAAKFSHLAKAEQDKTSEPIQATD